MTTEPTPHPHAFGAELRDVVVRYGNRAALDGATFALRPGVITGLIGRNGAGKSTAAALLAALRRPTSGTVLVDGEDPWENAWATANTQLIRESGDVLATRAAETLAYYADLRPGWDEELAGTLVDLFRVDLSQHPEAMSRGKRSAFGVVIGLASHCPLTILDEVHFGMDVPSRRAFYDALLADYAAHPRTIVVSSHLIEEIEPLVEDVVILDRGTVVAAEPADDLRARGVSLTGPADAVERIAGAHRVLARQALGPTVRLTVTAALDDAELQAAKAAGVAVGAVPLQDLFIHLTRPEES